MSVTPFEARVLRAIEACRGSLPDIHIAQMVELVQAGEPGVALENLCTQLDEYRVGLSRASTEEIRFLGEAMGIDSEYWLQLKELP